MLCWETVLCTSLTFVHTLQAEALTALFSVSFQGCSYNGQPRKMRFLFSSLEERTDLFIALKCSIILWSNVEECLFYREINITSFSGQRQASFLLLKKTGFPNSEFLSCKAAHSLCGHLPGLDCTVFVLPGGRELTPLWLCLSFLLNIEYYVLFLWPWNCMIFTSIHEAVAR